MCNYSVNESGGRFFFNYFFKHIFKFINVKIDFFFKKKRQHKNQFREPGQCVCKVCGVMEVCLKCCVMLLCCVREEINMFKSGLCREKSKWLMKIWPMLNVKSSVQA